MFFKKENTAQSPNFKTYEGFERIYHCHAEKMYKIGISQTQDEEITKEIIQDIFKSIWERRESLEIKESIENYLMRALKLKIIDHYRTRYSCKLVKEEAVCETNCGATNCTEEHIELSDLEVSLNALVDRLPCQCRKVFKMSHEKGMSTKEIASALLISERAVTYHMVKARTFLQKELKDYVIPLRSAI